MKKGIYFTVVLMIMFLIVGCATQRIVNKPSEITLENALVQVSNSLNKMNEVGKDHRKYGLIPAEVTVVFNIAAGGTDSGKLSVDVGPVAGANAGAEIGSVMNASRGNTITIKFVNLYLSSKDSLIGTMKPDDLKKATDLINTSNFGTLGIGVEGLLPKD